jgi:flagellum-specific peptidoglycan hydrolase FlgJ
MADDNNSEQMSKSTEEYIKSLEKAIAAQQRYGGQIKDAIAKSISQMDLSRKGTKEYNEEQKKLVRNLKKEYRELSEEVKHGVKSQKDLRDMAGELTVAIKHVSNSQTKRELQEIQMSAAKKAAYMDFADGIRESSAKTTSALTAGSSKFVRSLQANASSTELSASLLNTSVDVTASGLKVVGSGLSAFGSALLLAPTPVTKAAGAIASALGFVASAASESGKDLAKFGIDVASKEVDKTVKAFNDLSSSGALFSNGMTGMRTAAGDAGLTVDQFANVVKGSSEQLANSGMSVAEASKFTGGVLKAGGKSMKDSLLKLGYGFEEQGALIADVMQDMRGASTGPLKATEAEVAAQTQKYAENLRVIADITGEDAKKKMDQARDVSNQLAFQQKLAKMDETQRLNVVNAMGNMSDQQMKDYRDMIVFGKVINKTGAIMASQNTAYSQSLQESANATKNGTLDAEKQREINAKHNEAIQKGWLESTGIGNAGAAGLGGAASDAAEAMGKDLQYRKKWTKESIDAAKTAATDQKKTTDGLTNSVMTAEQAAQDLKIALQDVLTPAITEFATISKDMLQGVKALMKELGLTEKQTATDYRNQQEQLGAGPTSNLTGTGPMGMPEIKEPPPEKKEFYNKMYQSLLSEATKAGVKNPEAIARLGAAQSSVETGYGKSHIGEANNYFGIKADKSWQGQTLDKSTQEFENGKMVTKSQKFRKYGSMQESAADYIKFLQSNKRYQGVLSAGSAEEAIAEQAKTGYATDPAYAKKLAAITSRETWQAKEQQKNQKETVATATPAKSKPEQPKTESGTVATAKPAAIQIPHDKQTNVISSSNKEAELAKLNNRPVNADKLTAEQQTKNLEQAVGKPKVNPKLEKELQQIQNPYALAKSHSEIIEKGLDTYLGADFISGKQRFRNGKTGNFELRDTGPEEWQKQTYEKEQADKAATSNIKSELSTMGELKPFGQVGQVSEAAASLNTPQVPSAEQATAQMEQMQNIADRQKEMVENGSSGNSELVGALQDIHSETRRGNRINEKTAANTS